MSAHNTEGKIKRVLFSHVFLIGVLIFIQVVVFLALILFLTEKFAWIYNIMVIISIIMVIYMFSEDKSPDYKLVWALVIIVFPVFGGLFYLLWGKKSVDRRVIKGLRKQYELTNPLYPPNEKIRLELEERSQMLGLQARYLQNVAYAPVYRNCQAEYFPLGEDCLESLKIELEKAEKFILLEFFIISPGIMFDTILEILERKSRQGVEVYMLYDDAGSVARVDPDYDKQLREKGIHCYKFNKLRPQIYTFMNYRDHRKILVIDGKVGYMGGLNLADEYINVVKLHGHWKDTACLVRGEAVWSMTILFFQMWCFASKQEIDVYQFAASNTEIHEPGFVQPYGDDPLDDVNVAENAYLQVIQHAKHYVYIVSPYLILDSEMISSLKIAALSGIDVRIIVPGIPDKWYVDYVTKSNYKRLLEAGVRIFEYTPGFIHAKMFVTDDREAIIGTANLDYRSLYLHFECCTAFYYHKIVEDVKKDMLLTLDVCTEITLEDVLKTSWWVRFIQSLLRVIAPLM